MKCLRIFATLHGESHFDEVELPTTKVAVHPDAVPFDVTRSYSVTRVRITYIPAEMHPVAWHTGEGIWDRPEKPAESKMQMFDSGQLGSRP